jgi:progranulin
MRRGHFYNAAIDTEYTFSLCTITTLNHYEIGRCSPLTLEFHCLRALKTVIVAVGASSIRVSRLHAMLLLSSLHTLPSSLLLLVSCLSCSARLQSLEGSEDATLQPRHDSADETILKREADIQQRLQWQRPSAVRKMSGDPAEKFLLDYWIFESAADFFHNASSEAVLQDSMRPHSAASSNQYMPRYLDPRSLTMLFRRDFDCPGGSRACTSINRPNSCCNVDATCQLIQDNGFGDVGCCPSGETCGNSLSGCGSGAVSCQGGGCCLAGYECVQNGCLQASTTTIVVAPPTSTPARPTTITVTSVQTISQSNGPPETVTTTVIVTDTTTEEPEEPATTSTTEEESSSSSGLQPPVGPTSGDVVTTTAESTTTPPGDACPTGFYACSAVHQGGCCQTGQNCDTTSCPAIQSTTVVNTNGVTAVAPTGVEATGAAEARTCADGWFSCPASASGGCCPTGYGCAVSSCTATAAPDGGSHPVGKQAPEGSAVRIGLTDWIFLTMVGCTLSTVLAFTVL